MFKFLARLFGIQRIGYAMGYVGQDGPAMSFRVFVTLINGVQYRLGYNWQKHFIICRRVVAA